MRGLPGHSFAAPEFHYQGTGISGGFLLRRFFGSAISNATGYALGTAVSPTLVPFVQSLENEAWGRHQARPLQAIDVAAADARGFIQRGAAIDEASNTGIVDWRLAILRQLSQSAPPIETLLALRRRSAISEDELDTGIEQLGYLPEWRGHVKALRNVVPSVTDMVRFAVREVYNPAQRSALDLDAEFPDAFASDSENIGLSRERAGQYWAAHWELPSFEQLAAMLFRGELDAGSFSNALKALDYAPTWRGKLETIARPIPPLSDMIRFAVRDVYTPATVNRFGLNDDFPADFRTQAALHGMESPYPEQYWAAHWRLPSRLEGARMLWRGLVSPEDYKVLLKALDYSPFWRDRLEQIVHLVPGRIDLKRMLKYDILDRAQVKQGYVRLGYTESDAEHLTAIAEAEQGAATVTQPYLNRARSRLYTVAHNEYVDRSLGDPEATGLLAEIGVPAPQRQPILNLWQSERDVQRLELTPAQIKKAHKVGKYDTQTATAELAERGMDAADIDTYLNS